MLDMEVKEYMFILLQTGAMLNLFWLQDCFQGKHEKNIVIFYMVNGTKIIETYDSEAQAQERVAEIHTAMENFGMGSGSGLKKIIVSELPTTDIDENAMYLVPNPNGAGTDDYYDAYMYVEGKWELQGAAKSEVQIIEEQITWKEY